jgi:uncharacterized membrane protein YqhA
VVLLGVLGTFLASVSLYIFGLAGVVTYIASGLTLDDPFSYIHLKEFSIVLIQAIDIFLLATVLYIIALGLYELFIDETLDLPNWLEVKTLNDLEDRLLSVIVVILPVSFLGKLAEWNKGIDILWMGIAVGIVMLAVACNVYVTTHRHRSK